MTASAAATTYSTPEVMAITGMTKGGIHSLMRRGHLLPVTLGARGGHRAHRFDANAVDLMAAAIALGISAPTAAQLVRDGRLTVRLAGLTIGPASRIREMGESRGTAP